MAQISITRKNTPLSGEFDLPGDKSISHRAVMFGSIASGDTRIRGFLRGEDCLSTMSVFRQMGVEITDDKEEIIVHGRGLRGLKAPQEILNVGNSGTTIRLVSGILSAQKFPSRLTGDASICKRPMKRIITPLSSMGANISSLEGNDCAPLAIEPVEKLRGISYKSPIASAQVKSSILLAGLYADTPTSVEEPALSRNHTELMLRDFGAELNLKGTTSTIKPCSELHGVDILIPGDISSAAFFMAAALIVPGSGILIKNVDINPTRSGILKAAEKMGAKFEIINAKGLEEASGEPVCDLMVYHSELRGINISGEIIPTLIDELPIIAVLAAFAQGDTVISDAADLRAKESDRISLLCKNIKAMGGDVEELPDGMIIHGGKPLTGGIIDSAKDHRIAMSFAVAALAAEGETTIMDAECVDISFPGFYGMLGV